MHNAYLKLRDALAATACSIYQDAEAVVDTKLAHAKRSKEVARPLRRSTICKGRECS